MPYAPTASVPGTWSAEVILITDIASPWAQQINGGYYNYDWGWDSDITTAAHMTKIQPNNNASFTYWNSYSHAGEDSWLLQADLFVNGVQKY